MRKKWVVPFLIFLLFLPEVIHANGFPSKKNNRHIKHASKSAQSRQVAAFKIKKNVVKFVEKLRKEGFEPVVRKVTARNGETIYRIFVKVRKEEGKEALSSVQAKRDAASRKPSVTYKTVEAKRPSIEPEKPPGEAISPVKGTPVIGSEGLSEEEEFIEEEESSEEPEELSEGALPPAEVKSEAFSEKPPVQDKPLVTEIRSSKPEEREESTLPPPEVESAAGVEKSSAGEEPVGTSRERPSGEVFGRRGGFVHPFLAATEYYTDNVLNTRNNRESDYVTIISPGIWLTVPHVYEKLLNIETSNISPGGFSLSRYKSESFRRYQTYLFYNADIEQYSKATSGNTIDHKAEGFFQYNLRGGLSLDLVDQFVASHDARGTGISTELDKFRTNLSSLTLTYDLTERINLRADYSNFIVHYVADRNNFRDRTDNALSGYFFYKFWPKTSAFFEYEFVDISYNDNILFNSQEQHYFGGLQWDITAKSKGSVKGGYGTKEFPGSVIGTANDFILEAQIDHQITPKTSVKLKASRRTNETNISTTDFILSNTVEVEYLQRLTGKITGDARFSYTNDNYRGDLTFAGETKQRRDNYYTGAVALQYKFREWLSADTGYIYSRRLSNFADFEYTSNFIFLRVTGSL